METPQIQVLGELTVTSGDRVIPVPGSRKTRALLAYLLLRPRPATREHLCELLWPRPDDPRAALRWSLTKLRPVLNEDEERLVADRATVAVVGLSDSVDLLRVEKSLARPLDEIPTAELEAAESAFHGEVLDGLDLSGCWSYHEWLLGVRERARRRHRELLDTLVARHEQTPETALRFARKRVALDPLEEAAHVSVVRLLGRLGRPEEAKDQAERCREILSRELGVAPSPTLAEVVRETRPRDSRASEVATAKSEPPPLAEDAGLFGRADECAALEAFLAERNHPPVLLLEGEPGIGKSRLLAELERRAVAGERTVLHCRSWEAESVRPLGAWIDLLTKVDPRHVPEDLRAELSRLVPALGPAPELPVDEGRLFAAVADLIESLAGAGPLVLLFDDLHWIDSASAALLSFVARGPVAGRVAVAAAARRGELGDNEAARALVRSWARQRRLRRIQVGPLSDRDAAALARSLTTPENADEVAAACGGNPLYVIESAREGGAQPGGTLASLLGERLAALDETAGEVVRWAAVLGRETGATLLSSLCERPMAELLAAAENLERHGILRSRGEVWGFAHDLLRTAAYGSISGPRRVLMHRSVARVLSDVGDPGGAAAGDIAWHATLGSEPRRAALAAVDAGERALRLAAPDDAYTLAEGGLHEAGKIPGGAPTELSIDLLGIMVHAGLGRRRGETIGARLTELADRARAEGLAAPERTARYLLSVVSEEAGDFDAAHEHSLGAERAGRGADPETRLRALANTARCLLQLEREPDRAASLLEEAEELAEDLDAEVLDIAWGRGILGTMTGDSAEARIALAQGVDAARDTGDHWAAFECLARLSMLDLTTGDVDAVERRHTELVDAAESLGDGSEVDFAETIRALAHRDGGSGTDGLDAALANLRKADTKGRLAWALNAAARRDLADGDPETASARAREALDAATQVGRPLQVARSHLLIGKSDLAKDDRESARSHANRASEALGEASTGLAIRAEFDRLHQDIERTQGEAK